jgi:hypothetical protein
VHAFTYQYCWVSIVIPNKKLSEREFHGLLRRNNALGNRITLESTFCNVGRKYELVLLFGPQAVGKMTVGQELARITELKLFHNHMTIDLLEPYFLFQS